VTSISAIYYLYTRHEYRTEYEGIYATAAENSAEKTDAEIKQAFEKLEHAFGALEDGKTLETPEGYRGIGRLEGKSLSVYFSPESEIAQDTHPSITDKQKAAITGKDRRDMPSKAVSRGEFFGYNLIIYAVRNENYPEEYFVLLEDYSEFQTKMEGYLLDNVLLLDINGRVIVSLAGFSYTTLYDVYSANEFGLVEDENNRYLELNGTNHYFIKNSLKAEGVYYLSIVSGQRADAAIGSDVQSGLIFVAGVAGTSFIGAALLISVYLALNNKNLTGAFTRNKYSLMIDRFGRVRFANKNFRKSFDNVDIIENAIDINADIPKALKSNEDITLKLANIEGEERYIRFMTAESLFGYRLIGTDATTFMTDYKEARFLANCDYLTKLPNREQLERDFLFVTERDEEKLFCVGVLDIIGLERFKVMMGASFYDALKARFARRLASVFEDSVYHISDTRFVIFTRGMDMTHYLTHNMDKYTALLEPPIKVDNQLVKVDFRMGHCKPFFGRERVGLEPALTNARQALGAAILSRDKKIVGFFDALLRSDATVYENKKAVTDLIDNDLLMLHYQPQFSLKENRIIGFEALTRTKKKMNITISEFIALSEKNGSIIELGNFVYKSAMAFAKSIEKYNVRISLNVSPVQLMQEGFVENFLQYYRRHNLKPHSICIEITETFLMSNYEGILDNLNILFKEGVDIHLDDFGVVYSSMLYLKKLPITAIKIDREFIKDIDTDGYSKMIVDIITNSAKYLKLTSIAEGVETQEQTEALRRLECDVIQGFYISAAVSPEEAIALMDDNFSPIKGDK